MRNIPWKNSRICPCCVCRYVYTYDCTYPFDHRSNVAWNSIMSFIALAGSSPFFFPCNPKILDHPHRRNAVTIVRPRMIRRCVTDEWCPSSSKNPQATRGINHYLYRFSLTSPQSMSHRISSAHYRRPFCTHIILHKPLQYIVYIYILFR